MTDDQKEAEIAAFLEVWPNAEFGPAHIVVSDLNLESGHIQWCQGILYAVQEARKVQAGPVVFHQDNSDAELIATDRLLDKLLTGQDPWRLHLHSHNGKGHVTVESWRDVAPEP